jgi:hypothetical protein
MKTIFLIGCLSTLLLIALPSLVHAETCGSDIIGKNLMCSDEDSDCSVCDPIYDDYSLEFEGATSITWTPSQTNCPLNASFGSESARSQCNYSYDTDELVFFFTQGDGDGLPQVPAMFKGNIAMVDQGDIISGVSTINQLGLPSEQYFYSCGPLTVYNSDGLVTVIACIGQFHVTTGLFGGVGHYWILAAPNKDTYNQYVTDNTFDYPHIAAAGGMNYGMNAAIISSCFQSPNVNTPDGPYVDKDTFYLSKTQSGGGLGTLNCSCLTYGIDCDDLTSSNQLVSQLSKEQKNALTSMSKLVKAANTMTTQVLNMVAYMVDPAEFPDAANIADMIPDLE